MTRGVEVLHDRGDRDANIIRWSPSGDRESTRRGGEWIEITRATAPENHGSCPKILHRKTPRIKFNQEKILNGKLTHINEIVDNMGSND
jgi:hypothetical protein